MIRDEHIDAAVAQGILTADQAARLRDLARSDLAEPAAAEPPAGPDDEKFRLIGGFNDVFVTIGVALLVAAFFALASVIDFRPGFAVLATIAAWGLSEVFSRRMRLALPSIALALMFAGGAAFAGAALADLVAPRLSFVFAALGAALAAVAHERRFRVPINWAIVAVGVAYAVADAISLAAPAWMEHNRPALFAVLGLGIFLAALRVDASDIARQTRRSDVAFWLHLVAAPMIVHGMIPLLVGDADGMATGQALAVLGIFALLGLVAVIIDRRALLVSGLIYAGVAIGYLVSESVEKDLGASLTLLGLAALVLGLSAGWRALRRILLPLLPLGPLRQLVPPAI